MTKGEMLLKCDGFKKRKGKDSLLEIYFCIKIQMENSEVIELFRNFSPLILD